MKYALLLLASTAALADPQPASLTRFTYALDNLAKTYSGRIDYDSLAESGFTAAPGVNETPRQLLFRLESLFRLYSNAYPALSSQFLKPVKSLEDAIGHYGDTQDFLLEARDAQPPADPAYIQKLTQKNVDARSNLEALLKTWATAAGSPMVDQIRAAVTPVFSAVSPDLDRKTLVQQMIALVNELETRDFDMTKLESGIHELRRQARWTDFYSYAVGGLFVWDVTGAHAPCPDDAKAAGWDSLGMDSYMSAPAVAAVDNPCYISACLGAEISNIQNTLAGIKENAALGDAGQAKDPEYASADVIAQATALYDRLLGKDGGPKVLEELGTQLKACLPASAPDAPSPEQQ